MTEDNASRALPPSRRVDGLSACCCAGLFFFYTISQLTVMNAVAPAVIHSLHVSTTALSVISSVYLYGNALWLIVGGILLDYFSMRRLTLLFVVLCVVSIAVLALSSSISLDLVMRGIGGLGSAMSLLVGLRIAALWAPKKTAFAVGSIVAFGMSGGIVANAPFAFLVTHIGWRATLLVNAGLGVVILIFIFFFLVDKQNGRHHDATKITVKATAAQFFTVAAKTPNWRVGFYIGLMNLPIFVLAALWGNLYLTQSYGLSAVTAAAMISLLFLGEIAGAPVAGMLSDNMARRKPVMMAGAALSIALTAWLVLQTTFSPWLLSALFFLLGFAIAAQVIGYPLVAEVNAVRVMSTAGGFASFLSNLTGACAQLAFAGLLGYGWRPRYVHGVPWYGRAHFNHAMLLLLGAFVVSLLLALSLPETRCRRLDESSV